MPFRSGVVFSALLFATAVGAAAEPRMATGKWNVNLADAECMAHRDYGTPASPLRLVLKAPAVGDVMQVAVMRKAASSLPQQVASIVMIDGRRPLKTNLLMYT